MERCWSPIHVCTPPLDRHEPDAGLSLNLLLSGAVFSTHGTPTTFSLMTLKVRVALCRAKGARNLPRRVNIGGRSCLASLRRRYPGYSGQGFAGRMYIHDGLVFRKSDDSLVCLAPRLPAHGFFLNAVDFLNAVEVAASILRNLMASQIGGHRGGASSGQDATRGEEWEMTE